jgi:DNA-binding transcriptional regulator YdaS (Cro superfamily)
MSAMNKLKTWADAERGRISALARYLNTPASYVNNMVHGKKPVPIHHGAAIDAFTGGEVSRKDLFPDTWQRIWPELASTSTPASQEA